MKRDVIKGFAKKRRKLGNQDILSSCTCHHFPVCVRYKSNTSQSHLNSKALRLTVSAFQNPFHFKSISGSYNKRHTSGKVLEAEVWKFTQHCFFDRKGDLVWKMLHSCQPLWIQQNTVSFKAVWMRGWQRMLPTSEASRGSWLDSWAALRSGTSGVTWCRAHERCLDFSSFLHQCSTDWFGFQNLRGAGRKESWQRYKEVPTSL